MRRSTLLTILAVFAATAVVLALFLGKPSRPPATIEIPSVRNATPPGWKALYLLLQRLDHRVALLGTDWRHLPAATRVLIVGAALHQSASVPTPDETEALIEWVERGGRLIYLAATPSGFGDGTFRDLEDELGLRRTWHAIGPRKAPSDMGDVFGARRAEPLQVTRIAKHPLTTGVEALRLLEGPAFAKMPPGAKVLARGPRRAAYVAVFRRGEGVVYAISTTSLLSNRLIAEANNLDLFLNLLSDATDGALSAAVLFDEFHHSYRDVTARTVVRSGWFLALIFHVALLTCLFIASAGRRFGLPRPLHVEEHRASTEYVESIAGLYRQAHLARDALEVLHRRFLDRMGERYGLGRRASRATLTAALERRRPDLAQRLDKALRQAERLLDHPSPSEHAVAACCHHLYSLLEDERA